MVVYCGSSSGNKAEFTQGAQELGEKIADLNLRLVYGGAKVGLMGQIADSVLSHGGKVLGIIPKFLSRKEVIHDRLTELQVVDTMHERKTAMFEAGDAFIAMPGGFGTLEELFEILTWAQLGLHQKPIGILNVEGYYDHLLAQLDSMVDHELLKAHIREMILTDSTVDGLLQKMKDYTPISETKWISDIEQT